MVDYQQGGIISPVLANMTLDGLERTVKTAVSSPIRRHLKIKAEATPYHIIQIEPTGRVTPVAATIKGAIKIPRPTVFIVYPICLLPSLRALGLLYSPGFLLQPL